MQNSIYTNQYLAFNQVLLPEGEPAAGVRKEDGEVIIRIKAENARQAEVIMDEQIFAFAREGNGVWEWKCPYKQGIHYIQLLLDKTPVLTPYLPITYGYSKPYNYIDLGRDGEDFYQIKDVSHGSVRREYYRSSVTGTWESCIVYTPPCYERETETEFPVLYLQHGHGENEIGWTASGNVNFILDNLQAEEKAVPFLVVMNNGMVQTQQEGRGAIVDFMLFEKLLTCDVIPFIEEKYRVKKDKEHRALAGLSMGSLQTSITGFTHPELFSALGVFSGFMQNFIQGSEMDMVAREVSRNPHLELLNNREQFRKEFPVFFRAIGRDDAFIEHFIEDDRLCEEKNIPQIRKIYDGIHDWNVWRQCIRDFAQLIFR